MLDGSSNSIPVYTDGNNTYNLHYVVDSYINGTSWYRLYNDGWLEQGGYAQQIPGAGAYRVTLYKPYTSSDYCVSLTNWFNCSQPANCTLCAASYFDIDYESAAITGYAKWRSWGYAA